MKINQQFERSIRTKEAFLAQLYSDSSLINCTISPMDLRDVDFDWTQIRLENTSFLGCELSEQIQHDLRVRGATLLMRQAHLPYDPYRSDLYHWQELETILPGEALSTDERIYQHFSQSRWNPHINEALNQRIHDHAIDDALRELLVFDEKGMTERHCVGIMGGHSTKRTDAFFKKTAYTAQLLTQKGYYVVSGGGPGIMEAANLGAYFGPYQRADLDKALTMLAPAPTYHDHRYQDLAREVLKQYPNGAESLAIPTWFYGHEPSNFFATSIAKYFSNSLREDVLLAICLYGIVFAPGSAGTTQEIFQDAAQNHYGTHGYYSPMVFLSKKHYVDSMLFPMLRKLATGKTYRDLLFVNNEPEKLVNFLVNHPPIIASP